MAVSIGAQLGHKVRARLGWLEVDGIDSLLCFQLSASLMHGQRIEISRHNDSLAFLLSHRLSFF